MDLTRRSDDFQIRIGHDVAVDGHRQLTREFFGQPRIGRLEAGNQRPNRFAGQLNLKHSARVGGERSRKKNPSQ